MFPKNLLELLIDLVLNKPSIITIPVSYYVIFRLSINSGKQLASHNENIHRTELIIMLRNSFHQHHKIILFLPFNRRKISVAASLWWIWNKAFLKMFIFFVVCSTIKFFMRKEKKLKKIYKKIFEYFLLFMFAFIFSKKNQLSAKYVYYRIMVFIK